MLVVSLPRSESLPMACKHSPVSYWRQVTWREYPHFYNFGTSHRFSFLKASTDQQSWVVIGEHVRLMLRLGESKMLAWQDQGGSKQRVSTGTLYGQLCYPRNKKLEIMPSWTWVSCLKRASSWTIASRTRYCQTWTKSGQ